MSEFVLQVSAGVGPVEVRRFVSKLAERFERICVENGLSPRDITFHGDEREPRSVSFRFGGAPPAWLRDEEGTHVLIHRSRERSKASRKRWFAAVELLDTVTSSDNEVGISKDDIVVSACRASGPGGQHVNKTSSAIRLHHLPSGIRIRSSSERSQKANMDHALRRLGAVLRERVTETRAHERAGHRSNHYRLIRGNAVRSYRLDEAGALELELPVR
ncbi:Peptide chain release factor 2 [Labilithrix luteola]|uniref:Peptide chain release factor 2 n=1 Tax=Labilithrix luteola TaxID=1391654 RepID=A0A0K1PKP1_9BACT|nr:peptide chain release factor-like protein [Labilithrix luteola]AKU93679.1 Peptide chain release factor 2 [Labilithrix luteola]